MSRSQAFGWAEEVPSVGPQDATLTHRAAFRVAAALLPAALPVLLPVCYAPILSCGLVVYSAPARHSRAGIVVVLASRKDSVRGETPLPQLAATSHVAGVGCQMCAFVAALGASEACDASTPRGCRMPALSVVRRVCWLENALRQPRASSDINPSNRMNRLNESVPGRRGGTVDSLQCYTSGRSRVRPQRTPSLAVSALEPSSLGGGHSVLARLIPFAGNRWDPILTIRPNLFARPGAVRGYSRWSTQEG